MDANCGGATSGRNPTALVVSAVGLAAVLVTTTAARPAAADPEPERWLQNNNIGMNLVTYDATADHTTTIADQTTLTEFTGLHYFIAPHVRVGAVLQFSELLAPLPPNGSSRFWTFAVLPQIGWNFWGPLTAAFIVTIAPWTRGRQDWLFGVQALFGGAVPLGHGVSLTAAIEIPVNFYPHVTIGLTPLIGVSVRF